jgi:hypothetical protein
VNLNLVLDVDVKAMNFRLRKKELLERAELVEQDAYRVKTAQAQDILRALAALCKRVRRRYGSPELFALILKRDTHVEF